MSQAQYDAARYISAQASNIRGPTDLQMGKVALTLGSSLVIRGPQTLELLFALLFHLFVLLNALLSILALATVEDPVHAGVEQDSGGGRAQQDRHQVGEHRKSHIKGRHGGGHMCGRPV